MLSATRGEHDEVVNKSARLRVGLYDGYVMLPLEMAAWDAF